MERPRSPALHEATLLGEANAGELRQAEQARVIEEHVQEMRRQIAHDLGQQVLHQAGLSELTSISPEGQPEALTSIEQGVARIALGGF